MQLAKQNTITLRCPIPREHRRVLSTNLSILFHVLIFALPVYFSLKAAQPKFDKQVTVDLISIAAPNLNGDTEKSEIVKKKEVEKPVLKNELVKPEVKKEQEIVKTVTKKDLPAFKKVATPVKQEQQKQLTRKQVTANGSGNNISNIIHTLSEGDFIRTVAPIYPRRAIDMGIQGKVVVKALINNSGKAEKVIIDSSSGFEALDDSALKAVSQWYFKPKFLNSDFANTWVKVPVRFILK